MLEGLLARKKLLIGITLLVVAIIISLVLYLNRPGSVHITSESGADIYVSTSRGGEYKKIGISKATYRTRKVPTTIYVITSKEDKKTISSTVLSRGDNKEITLSLKNKINASKLYDGALSYAHVDGPIVQGILPDDFSIVNFRTDREEEMRPEFVSLPYLNKIIWYNSNNFVYKTFKNTIGSFRNSENLSSSGIAEQISTLDDNNSVDEDYPEFTDISKAPDKPLVLLSSTGLFISDDMGATLRQIAHIQPNSDGTNAIYASNSHVYLHEGLDPAARDDEGTAETTTKLVEYDYSGKVTNTFEIASDTVSKVVEKDGITYILTDDKLFSIRSGKLSYVSLYFNYVRDITVYKDMLLVLGDDGMWQVDGSSLYLMYSFKDYAVGLAHSFSISGDKLIFGSQPSANNEGASETLITSF